MSKKIVAFSWADVVEIPKSALRRVLAASKMGIKCELIRLNECNLIPCKNCLRGPCYAKGLAPVFSKMTALGWRISFRERWLYFGRAGLVTVADRYRDRFRDRFRSQNGPGRLGDERDSGWANGRNLQRPGALFRGRRFDGELDQSWFVHFIQRHSRRRPMLLII